MANGTQKYEREIAEILERMDRDEPRVDRAKRQARLTLWQRWQAWQRRADRVRGLTGRGQHAAAWTWIGLTLAAGIVGILLHGISPLLGVLCGVAMVAIFFSPLFGQAGGLSSDSSAPRWRGKVVDLPPRGGILATLGYHWRRFRRRF